MRVLLIPEEGRGCTPDQEKGKRLVRLAEISAYFRGFIICTPKICTPKNIQVMRELTIVNLRTRTHLLTQALPYNLSIMLIVISKDRATPQCNPRNFFSYNPAKILHDFTINILVE